MTSLHELGKVRREIANITAKLQRTDESLAATHGTKEADFLYTQLEILGKQKLVLLEQEKILLQGSSSSDKVQLDGKIAVLQSGNVETGQKRLLSLFRRGNELDLHKNGKPAGRLLLLNINALVPGPMPARVEVVGAQEGAILPEDDGNGLSQELFVYDTVIRLSPFQGLHSADGILQGTLANCSAMVQGTISNCSAFAKHLRFQVAHGHRD